MSGAINRKAFVTALGVTGLGLGLTVTGVGRTPAVFAQETTTPAVGVQSGGPLDQRLEQRQEFYADFTAALAQELNIANSDEVDAGIRQALLSVIDARVGEGELSAGQAESLKSLVATAEVPFGPLAMMGRGPGELMRGHHRGHMGPEWEDHARIGGPDDRGGANDGSAAAESEEG
jgi:hypothetical protein